MRNIKPVCKAALITHLHVMLFTYVLYHGRINDSFAFGRKVQVGSPIIVLTTFTPAMWRTLEHVFEIN